MARSSSLLSIDSCSIFITSSGRASSGPPSSRREATASWLEADTRNSSTRIVAHDVTRALVGWARSLALSSTACSKAGETRFSKASQSARVRSRSGASGTSRERSARPTTERCMPLVSCMCSSAPIARRALISWSAMRIAASPFSTARYTTRFTTSWRKWGASRSCTHCTASFTSPDSKYSSTSIATAPFSSSAELFAPAPQMFMMSVDECCSIRLFTCSRTSLTRGEAAMRRAGTSETNTGGRTSSTVARAMKRARSWAALGVSSATSSIDRSTRMNPSKNCSEP
mmetsp:Transcript_33956/g.77520  ORF Transcript_33956/g.77520 Transcript_33956/m.77520 type:complete len:286 (-) Transcript_33956:1146-2003(-)